MYIGLTQPAYRLMQRKTSLLWRLSGRRHLSLSSQRCSWRNETPPGGLTEILVYHPESQIAWPDSTLGIFAQSDPRFVLPGNVGVPLTQLEDHSEVAEGNTTSKESKESTIPRLRLDVLEEKTSREHQAQTLYSAHDFIQYTYGSESYVCSNPVLLENFPTAFADMQSAGRFELHEAPQLLKKELVSLFPGNKALVGGTVSVITVARETKNDMSTWSDQVEEERETHTMQFVALAKEICCR